jgi:hypothetical protein
MTITIIMTAVIITATNASESEEKKEYFILSVET